MEIFSSFAGDFLYRSILVTAVITGFCYLFAVLAVRLLPRKSSGVVAGGGASSKKSCGCSCSCSDRAPVVVERQSGASMMEQLVPEIRTHALSYLDYESLCLLSMTNSSMRKAANDDNAWKSLYGKDFTLEQDNVRPVNGWKAYYASTRAVVNINAEFFNAIRDNSISAMNRLWLSADYVKCIHASGELFTGFAAVMQSWQVAFAWDQAVNFHIREVRARVVTDMAWVTMQGFMANEDNGPFNITNVFEFHGGRWYMVHHHCSLMDENGDMMEQ